MREEYYAQAEPKIGKAAVDALRELYDLYDERVYIWYAKLWDPVIGGFYFSESGRDAKGFLPDIESTVQALTFLESSGITQGKSYIEAAPEEMRKALSRFVKSLQDPEDGYFYHPQWGKNIITPRRGRDIGWATSLLEALGEKADYPTALERLSTGNKADSFPEYLLSVEKWREYLRTFDMVTKSYWSGNMLQSQARQIKAAGQEYVDELFKWLAEIQRADNGLWEPQLNYASVNGLMKLSLMYTSLGGFLPNAEAAMNSAIDVSMSDQEIVFCCQFYNPLVTMQNILYNMRKNGSAEKAEALQQIIINRAPEFLRKTKKKVSTCLRPSGVFSYNPTAHSRFSQKAPVGLGLDEGDVNATSICSTGIVRNVCIDLGIPRIPLYCKEDSELFYDIIKNSEQWEKIYEKPEWFDAAIDPAKLTETY